MVPVVVPQLKREFAAAERTRLASLGREELVKEEANKLFQVPSRVACGAVWRAGRGGLGTP